MNCIEHLFLCLFLVLQLIEHQYMWDFVNWFIVYPFYIVATYILLKPYRVSRGSLVGYCTSGPLYNYAGEAFHRTSQSFFIVLKNGLHKILEEPDSRKIFYFLCINLVNILLCVYII